MTEAPAACEPRSSRDASRHGLAIIALVARRDRSSTVYSSEHGRVCPHCGLPTRRCQCRANPRGSTSVMNADGDGIVRVGRSSKGRGGKTVTTITGIQRSPAELRELARDLKRACGSGGALKDGVIEIQGDHRDTLVGELEGLGFRVKRAGG